MPNNVELHLDEDKLAADIACKFQSWESSKQQWYKEYQETLEYVFATDTKGIMTQRHPYNNSTHIPKLTNIADTLRTYYLESIFSLRNPIDFDNYLSTGEELKKKRAIAKFANKVLLTRTNFKPIIRQVVEDYIYAGNGFAMPVWETETVKLPDGSIGTREKGLKFVRFNPADIVFDVTAESFMKSPKIIRSIKSIADVATLAESDPDMQKAFQRALKNRNNVRNVFTSGDNIVNAELHIAGFGSVMEYYMSDMVEILTFFGDVFDMDTNTLQKSRKITVMDRAIVLSNEPMDDTFDYVPLYQTRWRDRVDNLWGMSPLANLLGMQYRIDFLENKRADVYDFISNPILKTKGDISLPEVIGPMSEINCPIDGDVDFLSPNSTILTADTYIDRYKYDMDVMAGTPSEAIGFRTPGEKTMFEVTQLQNAAARIFNRQVRKFEEEMIEPLLNAALKLFAKKNKGIEITVEGETDEGTTETVKIMAEDLVRPGALTAVGSINYADKAVMAQTLQQLGNSNIFMDEAVRANFSPSKIGYIIAYATGLDKVAGLYSKDARLYEVTDQQKLSEHLMQQVDEVRVDGLIDQQAKAQKARQLAEEGVSPDEIPDEEEV